MKIAVRLDDITPDMDWERFFKFKALLDQYQVKPLIGVVPDNRDENLIKIRQGRVEKDIPKDFWAYLRDLGSQGWTIAMHGYQHIYTTKKGGIFPLNNFSEFAGVPFEKQKEMLMAGKRLLSQKKIETDLFMAPAHSYDRNTLRALKETGFKALTDGFGDLPYEWRKLIFYPISFQLSGSFKKDSGYSTMVVHTDTVSDEDLERYKNYFEKADAEWISYGEYLRQTPVKRGCFGMAKEFLMAKGKYLLMKLRQKK